MKVFLGNPPWRVGDQCGVRAGSRWPHLLPLDEGRKWPGYLPFPFYLAYSAAVLEQDGFEVLLVDAIAEGMDDDAFVATVKDFAPDIYVTETSTPSFYHDMNFAQRVHAELGRATRIALAGPHVSTMKEQTLIDQPFIDAVLMGEYDYCMRDYARALRENDSDSPLPGVIRRTSTGDIVTGGKRELIDNIDEIPWPARRFLPMTHYNDSFCDLPTPSLQMWASRGCPFTCVFCLWPQVMYEGTRYRVRDPKDVVAEIIDASETYGMKSVYFDDDTFDIGKKRMRVLADEMIKQGFTLPWAAMARADTIDPPTLEKLAEAGLYAIKYGVESSDQEILETSGKRLDLRKMEETLKATHALGIKSHLTFTFGLPGETWDTIRRSIDYSIKLNPDSLQYSISTPFPGTAQYNWAKENGYLLTEDWAQFNGSGSAVVRTEALSAEDLARSIDYAYKRWYTHKAIDEALHNSKGRRWTYVWKAAKNPAEAAHRLGIYVAQRRRSKEAQLYTQ